MIYLEETLNLTPATPVVRDDYVAFASARLMPAYTGLAARLVAAWGCDSERFAQITQILEFDDFGAFGRFREALAADPELAPLTQELDSFAPTRRHRLLEPIVPSFVPVLHDAIASSQDTPLHSYNLAILTVAPGMMKPMSEGLAAISESRALPIAMSWRVVTGNPNEIIDLWKGSLERPGHQTQASFTAGGLDEAWWQNLRVVAPDERVVPVYPVPYSPLR